MKSIFAAIALMALPAAGAAADTTVADVMRFDADNRAGVISGVYDGFNFAKHLDRQATCEAPDGTSRGTIVAMIVDQWRSHQGYYYDMPLALGTAAAMCSLWGPPDQKPHVK